MLQLKVELERMEQSAAEVEETVGMLRSQNEVLSRVWRLGVRYVWTITYNIVNILFRLFMAASWKLRRQWNYCLSRLYFSSPCYR